MANSLQDQLLNAGLVNKKKAKQVSKDKRKQKKVQHKNKETVVTEAQKAAQKAQEEKKAKDLELNQQKQQEEERKAIAAQIIQLIEHYRVARNNGEREYNFTDGNTVKKILTTDLQADQLSRGRLCIARIGESYELIPKPIADKIAERDDNAIVVNNYDAEKAADTIEPGSDEEYYSQFEIPDDLMW